MEALSGPHCEGGYPKYSLEVLFGGGGRFKAEEAGAAGICMADLQYGRGESYIVKQLLRPSYRPFSLCLNIKLYVHWMELHKNSQRATFWEL